MQGLISEDPDKLGLKIASFERLNYKETQMKHALSI